MKTADLHNHSTISDGTLTPEELIDYAVEKNLSAVALTDHDTTGGLERAYNQSLKYEGLDFVNGIEISVASHNREIHVLGLFIDRNSKELNKFLEKMQTTRHNRNVDMIGLMNTHGINISMEDLICTQGEAPLLTRAHFANTLIKKGYAKDFQDAFNRYLTQGTNTYIPRTLVSPEDAIEIIHQAGGLTFMAHPSLYKTTEEEFIIIFEDFIEKGLDGIEAIYSTFTPEQEIYYNEIAKKYNLLITGGSDFHGKHKPGLDMAIGCGNLVIPYSIYENIKAHLK